MEATKRYTATGTAILQEQDKVGTCNGKKNVGETMYSHDINEQAEKME